MLLECGLYQPGFPVSGSQSEGHSYLVNYSVLQ